MHSIEAIFCCLKVNTADHLEITCGSGKAEFDPSTNVLTLTDAVINADRSAIRTQEAGDITIVVKGTNTITVTDPEVFAIHPVCDDLTLTGNGSLAITTASSGGYDAIYVEEGNLTVDMDGDLILHAGDEGRGAYVEGTLSILGDGNIEIESGEDGFYADDDITISGDGDITIDTETESAICIYDGNFSISGGGDLTITSLSAGLDISGDVTLSGSGDIQIESSYYAIISWNGDVTVNGSSDITLTTSASDSSSGIHSGSGNVYLSGEGNISINSGSLGIGAAKDIIISGSGNTEITAVNQDALYSAGGNVELSGSGDISLNSYSTGIEAAYDITISGTGNKNITAANQYAFYSAAGDIELSGSGDITATAKNGFAMVLYSGNVILSGNGKVTVASENSHGAVIINTASGLKLEGTTNPVTITAGPECYAVYNGTDAPTGGSCFENYIVEGDPDTSSVIYRLGTLTFKFDMCGHGTAIADQSVKNGKTAEKPADPTANGFVFDGWYVDADYTEKYDFSAPVALNTTVYAKWTKNAEPTEPKEPAEPTEPTEPKKPIGPESPKTGDISQSGIFAAMFVISGLVLAAYAAWLFVRRKNAR